MQNSVGVDYFAKGKTCYSSHVGFYEVALSGLQVFVIAQMRFSTVHVCASIWVLGCARVCWWHSIDSHFKWAWRCFAEFICYQFGASQNWLCGCWSVHEKNVRLNTQHATYSSIGKQSRTIFPSTCTRDGTQRAEQNIATEACQQWMFEDIVSVASKTWIIENVETVM